MFYRAVLLRCVLWFGLAVGCCEAITTVGGQSGWGVDACLSIFPPAGTREGYTELLQPAKLVWMRERGVGVIKSESGKVDPRVATILKTFRWHQQEGRKVVAFFSLPLPHTKVRPGNQLVEDLREVYAQAVYQGREYYGLVDAWEMVGEPDLGYCRDLPERTVAFQKAAYLGLKAGAREAGAKPGEEPLVLMGALGLPVSPWLKRAVQSGLLDYTDAYNFHHYGWAKSLDGVISGHAAFVADYCAKAGRPNLPLWITECGLKAVTKEDFLNPGRRRLQADYVVETARQAWAHPAVAMFMPFILVHEGDGYAMTLSPTQPLPAWEAYARFTRENPWPERPLAAPPAEVNPVVLQWLPDNRTVDTHKVSGTYRPKPGIAISGEIRLNNLGSEEIRGRLVAPPDGAVSIIWLDDVESEITVPAGGMVSLSLLAEAKTDSYFREEWPFEFRDQHGRTSRLLVAWEAKPHESTMVEHPLSWMSQDKDGSLPASMTEGRIVSGESGGWTAFNGLRVRSAKPGEVELWCDKTNADSLVPQYVAAKVAGLPSSGFIRVKADRAIGLPDEVFRVDLVDVRGRRFTIWENFGISYTESSDELWLNIADFHLYGWGRTEGDPKLNPVEVREIHLRTYLGKTGQPLHLQISCWQPRNQ